MEQFFDFLFSSRTCLIIKVLSYLLSYIKHKYSPGMCKTGNMCKMEYHHALLF